jgi:NAD(P)-dependent dehydrogenase (short-subunit alcohol dehydrogenase family)
VNSVAPGRIQTARADRLLEATAAAQRTSPEVLMSQLVRAIPLARVGPIDDIADAVCFLVSERARASYVNGAVLVVDRSTSLVI